jgi:ABC-type dipeptide/oligopeptide/nickel transport system permease component
MTAVSVAPVADPVAEPAPAPGPWERHGWWVARVAVLPVHLFVFAIGVFFLVRLVPGDPIMAMTGGNITPERYAVARHALGLDGSVTDQLATFLGNLVRFDLGESLISGRSVAGEFGSRLPATVELAVLGMAAALLVAFAASYLIVFRPRNPVSKVLAVYSRTAGALPEFCLGVFLVFVFYAVLKWVPAPLGRTDPKLGRGGSVTGLPLLDTVLTGRFDLTLSMAAHLVLPIAVMVLAQAALLIKLLVGGLERALAEPPTLFRVASGVSGPTVLLSVYRRALPAMVAMAGTIFGYLLGAAVIVEQLFGLGGMGQYAVDAVNGADIVALQGFLVVIAVLSLVVFLVVDLITMSLDPRRRTGSGGAVS